MFIRDIIQLYCRDWCGGVAAPRFCGHFEMDLMVQNLSIPIASRKKATLGAMSERPCYLQILCRPPFGANSLRGNAPGGKVTTGPVIPPLSAAVAAAIPYCPARSSVGAHASPLMRLVRRAARPRLPSGRGTGQGEPGGITP